MTQIPQNGAAYCRPVQGLVQPIRHAGDIDASAYAAKGNDGAWTGSQTNWKAP